MGLIQEWLHVDSVDGVADVTKVENAHRHARVLYLISILFKHASLLKPRETRRNYVICEGWCGKRKESLSPFDLHLAGSLRSAHITYRSLSHLADDTKCENVVLFENVE